MTDKEQSKLVESAVFYDEAAEQCFQDGLVDPDRWLAQHIGRLYGHIDILTEEVKALKRRIKKHEAST